MSVRPRTALIIGGGPSGVAAAVEFHRAGWLVRLFERQDGVGGVFRQGWNGLRLVSSSAITDFSTFDHPRYKRSQAVFYTAREYVEYIEAYLEHAGPDPECLRFGHEITELRLDDQTDRWTLTERNIMSGAITRHTGDLAIVCSGLHSHASTLPPLPGLERFEGQVVISSDFRDADQFAGRNVLVVGAGESASDIAHLVSEYADKLYISSRRGPGVVIPRRDASGSANDIYTSRAYYSPRAHPRLANIHSGLARSFSEWLASDAEQPDSNDASARSWAHRVNLEPGKLRDTPFRRFGTKSIGIGRAIANGAVEKPGLVELSQGSARFADGSEVNCDVVIFAVGFPAPRLPWLVDLPDPDVRRLYKRVIPLSPRLSRRLAFVGFARPTVGAIPPLAEMQARLVLALAEGTIELPSVAAMEAELERWDEQLSRQFPLDYPQRASLVDFVSYLTDLAQVIGCEPQQLSLLRTDPALWFRVVFGPIHSAQFRLNGSPEERHAARERILNLPHMPAAYVAWSSLWAVASECLELYEGSRAERLLEHLSGLAKRSASSPPPEPTSSHSRRPSAVEGAAPAAPHRPRGV